MGDDFEKQRKRHASGESTFSNDSVSNYIPTPPDGGWGWVIVFASFCVHVIVDGITFTFGVFYMEFLTAFGESKGKTALVGSLLAGFYLMSGPITSALVNRYGCRPVCIGGSIIASAAFVFSTLSKTIDVLMLTYGVLAGFGFGLMYLPSIISVSYYFEKKRALATGIAVCGAGVGGFVFAPAGRVLLRYFDWRNALYIVAGITLLGCIMGALMRPLEPPRGKPRKKNFFDRMREKANRNRSESTDTNTFYGVKDRDNIIQGVQEAKLAREQKLHDEEGESVYGSFPNSVVNSLRNLKILGGSGSNASTRNNSVTNNQSRPISQNTSRKNSALQSTGEGVVTPLLINQDCDLGDGDEAELLRRKISEESAPSSRRTSRGPPALPPHMRKEVEHGLKNGVVVNNNDDLPPKQDLLKPTMNGQHSISVSDVMAFSPRARVRAPVGATKADYARPLYRRDIFYSGSILHIPNFRSQPDVKMYVASITTIPNDVPPEKESRVWRCMPIPKVAKDVLKEMLDVSLLKDPVFLIACLGEIFGFIGLFIPFVYVTERSVALGVEATKASFLLSVIGITNTVGRIVSGFLADFPQINSLLLHNVMMILGGVACIMNMFATTYPLMVVYCAFFGLCVATYISLTSIILCNLMGLEKLTSAFGFLTLVRGLASIAGPPVAGMVFDATKDYDMSFHVGGVMFILAGGFYCLLHLPMFSRNMIQKVIDEHLDEAITDVTITPEVKIEVESPVEETREGPGDRLLTGNPKKEGERQEVTAQIESGETDAQNYDRNSIA